MEIEGLVKQVKELQSSNPTAKVQWNKYTDEFGARTRDPSKHTAEFLQEFISMIATGGMASTGIGQISEGTSLVEHIKNLQRTNADAKEQWLAFAESQGNGVLDPAKHTEESLTSFIDHLSAGGSFAAEGTNFGEVVKSLQKRSSSFKIAWAMYCKLHAGGKCDPSQHDSAFHSKFFESLARVYVQGGAGGGAAAGQAAVAEPPAKKLKTMVTPPVAMGAAGPTKESLAQAVKDFQKSGVENKELWAEYTDSYLGGKRDPAKHETEVLLEFCVNHGVPFAQGGMAAPKPMIQPMVGAVFGAIKPTGGAMFGAKAGGMAAMAGGGGGDKTALVERVKAFQKSSRENAELWSAFCGATKDPNKHEPATLQQFCSMYGC